MIHFIYHFIIEECVNVELNNMNYLQGSEERLLKAVCKENVLEMNDPGKNRASYIEDHTRKYREKSLHGQFVTGTEETRDPNSLGTA